MSKVQMRMVVVVSLALVCLGSLRSEGASILREVWEGIGGTAVSDLTSSPNYPNNPTSSSQVTDFFEAPTDVMENYGQRMHGYIVPPITGNYTFWIASDDGGELWLSTDELPANQQRIATVNSWTASREWTKEANQQSAPVRLEADKAYYISALMKEGGGGDNLAVRWLRPDGVDQAPIPATYLYPWGTAFTPPRITAQPQNTSAVEGAIATFTVGIDPLAPSNAQWRKNGANISGATSLTLNYGPVTMLDDKAKFMVVLTNRLGSTNSQEALLTVTPDVTSPTLVSALNLGVQTTVRVVFSEPVDAATATDRTNYNFNNGIGVNSAVMGSDTRTVILTTTPLTFGTSYTITVNRVRDRAATPNTIAANSTISFTAVEYAPVDIGGTGGSTIDVPGGFDVTGKGKDLGGTTDEFQFGYQERTGDFDVQVRVENVTITDAWVQAGLIARETLDGNSRFAGIFSSSAELGCIFESRGAPGAASTLAAPTGGFPVNYPEMYLRLRRVGTAFTGYAGFDGKNWQQIGTTTLTLPSKVYFGMAVSSHNRDVAATARFRDLKAVSLPGSFTFTQTNESMGPSNRRTGLIFSEVMYNPAPRTDTNNLEFVEIYNAESVFVDLGGWRLSGGIDYVFPEGVRLYPGGLLVVAADPDALAEESGYSGALGPFSGRLNNGGDRVVLLNKAGAVRLEVEYDSKAPWPVSADGTGHSLVLTRPSYGEDDPRAWSASAIKGGSPGQIDAIRPNKWAGVVINEFLAHTDDPVVDFIELYNASNTAVDITGCYLTDDTATNKFKITATTILPVRGFASFDQNELGFALSSGGERIFLVSADGSRVLDAVQFEGQENGVSSGRVPDGAATIRRLVSVTEGAPNSTWRVEDVVINEIMYHPITNEDDEQYVELHNRSGAAVDVGGWKFEAGINYQFPDGTSIPPLGYVVVAKDKARLLANYPQLNDSNTFGDFDGRLSRNGERLALAKRDFVQTTNEFGTVITSPIYITVSEVSYVDGGRWPELADGGGSSLELIDPRADTLRAPNWKASDERAKSQWATLETTGVMDHGNGQQPANRLYITMLGAGECLVDDVEVIRSGGGNLLSNPGFESGTGTTATGWTFFGNHKATTVDNTGAFSGARVLHIRAPGDGDTANNSIRTSLSTTLASGNTVTIRAKVKWLSGWPEVLMRVRGGWIELAKQMDVPRNLGTPGQPNSRRISNAGPAIFEVTHTPALPRANQPVVVTARITDPDGVASPRLRWRADGSSTLTQVTMGDNGLGGDALAGDGIYSGTIAGRAGGSLVAFRVEANDDGATSASSIFPEDAPVRECLIRWGDTIPFGTFEHHHIWNTSTTETAFNSSPPLDNTWRDSTLVYGMNRVIYNASFRHKGSPYHGGAGDIATTVPGDQLLLGIDDRIYASTGNGGSEGTGMKGDMANWLAEGLGIPFLHSHYIQMYRNGAQFREILYDLEQPNRYMAESWFGGGEVNDPLYKIAGWFEFADDNNNFGVTWATLERFLSGGNLKLARYRWNWQIRPDGNTANDYASVFNLANVVNNTTERVTRLPQIADMEEWMRCFAYERIIGNWDSWTLGPGQNMFLYTPLGERAQLIPWDIDFVLGDGNGTSAGLMDVNDPAMSGIFNLPIYRRMLWRAYQDAINGPMLAEKYGPQVDARRAALLKNGVNLADPAGIKSYMEGRKSYIRTQLQSADTATFQITNNSGNDFTTANGVVPLTGTAPFAVATIEVNGVPYSVTWTALTTWRIDVPMGAASNPLTVVGKDLRGNVIAGATDTITITYTGSVPQVQDWVSINEIMYNGLAPDSDYIELHNRHSTFSFDLSGFELSGVDYVFPVGTFIPPNGYLVIVENTGAFAAAYGANIPVLGPYSGNLQNNGETIRLVKPAVAPAEEVTLDDVRYEDKLPWAENAAGFGSALQLVDPARDNYRVGNWIATGTNDLNRATPGRANAGRVALPEFPLVWINEVLPNNGTGAQDNAGEREPWIELHNSGATAVDLGGTFLSDDPANLTRWQVPAGTTIQPGQFMVIWADGEGQESQAGALHTNFRLNQTNGIVLFSRTQPNGTGTMDYVRYATSAADQAFGSYPDGEPRRRRLLYTPTPGAKNDPTIPTLRVFINEWMASNTTTLQDPADNQYEDWFELYNAGTTEINLSGFYLTDNRGKPKQYTIPVGTVIPAGGFRLFWADSEPAQDAPDRDLHLNFGLSNDGEEIALYTPDLALVDLVTFGPQLSNVSQGRFPDGAEPPFLSFTLASPAAPNISETGNQPPTIAAIANREVNEGTAVQLRVSASDPDAGQTLTFSLLNPPAGATISQSGDFAWTPGEVDGPGVFTITVRVQDNGTPIRSATTSFRITVAELNTGPSLGLIDPAVIDEGSPLNFQAVGTDPDLPGQPLVYSFVGAVPAGAVIDPATGEFSWVPAEDQGPGEYDFTVKVTDPGQLSASQSFHVSVREVNNKPVVTEVGPQSIDEGTAFTLQIVARDPDNPPAQLSYRITQSPAGVTIDAATGLLSWTPTEADGPRDHNISVEVAEAGSPLSSTVSFLVGVREVNTVPELQPFTKIFASPGQNIQVTATASDPDLPAQTLSFTAVNGLPAGAALDTRTGIFTWTISDDPQLGTNEIVIRVTDDGPGGLNAEQTLTIVVQGGLRVAINEILHRPSVANAEFVEIYNYSGGNTVDLTGWRLEGYNFTFPAGTTLAPGGFLCVAKNMGAFQAAYGNGPAVAGPATVTVGADGGAIRLLRPRGATLPDEVIDETVFSLQAPWPASAATQGASLQLLDVREDHQRVANWGASVGNRTNPPVNLKTITGPWKYSQSFPGATWAQSSFVDTSWPTSNAVFYVENAALPATKNTELTLGSTTYYFRTKFIYTGNTAGAFFNFQTLLDDGAVFYLNAQELMRPGMREGDVVNDDTFASRVVGDAAFETFANIEAKGLREGENVLAVEVHQTNPGSSDVVFAAAVDLVTLSAASFTPGAPNSVTTDLEAFPPVWINEVLPNNTSGLQDNAGDRDPWIELYNSGATDVSLNGWHLTDNFGALTKWAFPAGTLVPAGGYLLVWADGETAESVAGRPHTSFRLNATSGSVALVRTQNGTPAVVDYLNYAVTAANQSFGSQTDGNPYTRQVLAVPSPAQSNQVTRPDAPTVSVAVTATGFRLSWSTQTGFTYTLQAADTVTGSNWETVHQATGDGSPGSFVDTSTKTTRFYRMSVQ